MVGFFDQARRMTSSTLSESPLMTLEYYFSARQQLGLHAVDRPQGEEANFYEIALNGRLIDANNP